MNLNDLTEELHHRADEARADDAGAPGAPGAIGRIQAVQHRIQVRRRRRVAAAGAVVLCAVATAFAIPSIDFGRERTLPAGDDTIFRDHDGGDPLRASVVGQPGEHEVSVTFTPSDLDFSVTALCSDPEAPQTPSYADPGRMFEVRTSQGDQFIGGSCHAEAVPSTWFTFGDTATQNVEGWKSLGLVPGQPVTLFVRLGDPENWPPVDQIRLGIAVYERSGERVTADDVTLRKLITVGGRDYRLVEQHFGDPADDGGITEVDVPASTERPFVIVAGATARTEIKNPTGRVRLWIDGNLADESEGWGMSTQALEDTDPHHVKLEVTGNQQGTALIAYYEPLD